MDTRAWAAQNLAARLLAGPWTETAVIDGVDAVAGAAHPRTRAALVSHLVAWGAFYPPAPQELAAFLRGSPFFRPPPGVVVPTVLDAPRFAPAPPFVGLPIPELATPGALGEWLGEAPEQVAWLADQRRGHGRSVAPALQHYRYHVISKQGGRLRLVEAPKSRLKAIQRRILREILAAVPVHRCAHGFVAGRSCVTGAQVHAGEAMVMTFDLAEFFPSIGARRIHGLFRRLGYPWAVARLLAGLCTTITPVSVMAQLADGDHRALYGVPHLPQGAPTSPALANLLAWRLDRRLSGLARAAGANYTRYADDLAFSGDERFAACADRLDKAVATILREEGFTKNPAKTRIMPANTRQHVTGIVVNAHCNTARGEFDKLKAILYNCARTGPAAQNHTNLADFRRHLEGRIAWVQQVNPARAMKLWRLFDQVDWFAKPQSR